MTLNDFMHTESYEEYLDALDRVLPEKIDRVTPIHDFIIEVDNESLQQAKVSLDALDELIKNDRDKTINWIVKKNDAYLESGGEDNIVNNAPQINFPIGHLIEYYLLAYHPDGLVAYIKAIGIPGAKKYAKELNELYARISG
ncbi:hypothetical protein PMPD1_0277 [Paramixta manurensis]|uniref:Uncharacterized protein n=1 Tax=Paramixta manurensis TaxID=2740817 RepID=A0A6M8U3G6_9GAMM|nr:hypothetical protein PMPD1_0277 [Erwiniaceae bacterium PD-1]